MSLTNRLTEFLGIEHPILLAPMAQISGGRLAAAVTRAGGMKERSTTCWHLLL